MKTVKKQVYLTAESIECEKNWFETGYRYTFTSKEPIDIYSMEHFVETRIPENIGEFIEIHKLSKIELLAWLITNYK
jgi:hypothetical protein